MHPIEIMHSVAIIALLAFSAVADHTSVRTGSKIRWASQSGSQEHNSMDRVVDDLADRLLERTLLKSSLHNGTDYGSMPLLQGQLEHITLGKPGHVAVTHQRSLRSFSLPRAVPYSLPVSPTSRQASSWPQSQRRLIRDPHVSGMQSTLARAPVNVILRAIPDDLSVATSSSTVVGTATSKIDSAGSRKEGLAVTAIRKYFEAWNKRDMDSACECFAGNCEYEDTQYAGAFSGKAALKQHLIKVADALPSTFAFVIDEIADGGDTVGVQWHVENDGQPLPFTRGCSMYRADPSTGLLVSGFDVPEPAPLKPGSASLAVLSLASKLIQEPVRAVPLTMWGLYVSIVFFSNGILPGPDASQLDAATWEEVLGLSLNFWLIAPLLNMPFSPALHPGLEGIFNLLLAWAAAFVGFLSDGRPGRASGSMLPTVAGMQFLTNAFFLPYLAVRAPETDSKVFYEDLDPQEAKVSESRFVGPLLAGVGTGSIVWALMARPEYGDLATRMASLTELLSGDRLGSSFVVDLILFGFFQGWLVDDDLKRRGLGNLTDAPALRALAKFVPFYGLCAYLVARPPLPRRSEQGGG
eukprot:gnl/MRDRNA2_/MRDRNA2_164718_c0_seq1.p1 gnl/MRDRNA2_/MRDRNA2_164718_c0~~gnl/MRDRNA2_/MRDRNA2_164718_c0_seq1.p1  ORF type:complete len:581 (+),score=94.76 gnl/MRDRNA2_/MRDRNA2_164718_c0_seq1:54-1796(+)